MLETNWLSSHSQEVLYSKLSWASKNSLTSIAFLLQQTFHHTISLKNRPFDQYDFRNSNWEAE